MLFFGFLCISINNSSNFFIEDAVVDVGFFRMEIFIKGSADNTVRIDSDAKLFSNFADVCIVSR